MGLAPGNEVEPQRVYLSVEPVRLLELLVGFERLRIVTGNPAVTIEQGGPIARVRPEGVAVLADGAELWLFAKHCRVMTVVVRPGAGGSAFDFQLLLDSRTPILELKVEPSEPDGRRRILDAIERWRVPATLAVAHVERRSSAHRARTGPGLGAALGSARNGGDVRAFHELISRHGLERLDALSLLGEPWAHRIVTVGPDALIAQVATRRLLVQLVVGNEGATYVRSGAISVASEDRSRLVARAGTARVVVRPRMLDNLWAVGLSDGGRTVSSLEAYDLEGQPALFAFGARGADGRESSAWRALVEGSRGALEDDQPVRGLERHEVQM